jgi:hypothetical protein
MKYRVSARNLVSFAMGEIIEAAALEAAGVPIDKRVASGHLEPVVEQPKKNSTTKKESD